MAPFPESATLGWVIGLGIAIALVACMVIGLTVRLAPEETITPEQQANQGNQRAQKTRDWRSCARRAWIPAMASRSATATPMPPALRSPKIEISEAAKVLMGELRPRLPESSSFNPKLEAALERWKKAAEGQGLFTRFASDAASAVV